VSLCVFSCAASLSLLIRKTASSSFRRIHVYLKFHSEFAGGFSTATFTFDSKDSFELEIRSRILAGQFKLKKDQDIEDEIDIFLLPLTSSLMGYLV
jgi:hypothetical protein